MKLLVGISAALIAAFSISALAASTIKLVNQSGWDIHEVYFSSARQSDWGSDQLGNEVLEQGDSLTLSGVSSGKWDIRLVDEDGDECVLENVHITTSKHWVITEERLLGCQAAGE